MANFPFYFILKEVNLNKEKNVLELAIESHGQGITAFPYNKENIDILTNFWLLELPTNSENKQLFLTEEVINKEFIILDIHEKALENSTMLYAFHSDERKFQSKFTVEEGTYSQIRKLLPSEKRPPLDWNDLFEKPNSERRDVGWQILWNPLDGKLWSPPLEDWEKNKFFENNKLPCQKIATNIYKERLNKLNKTFDLHFACRGLQIPNSRYRKSIKILCDLTVPNKVIREFIMWNGVRQEFDNSLIGEIEIIFDEENSNESVALFEKIKELLNPSRKGDKFSLRNIPLLCHSNYNNAPVGFSIDNAFRSDDYNRWQSITKIDAKFTKRWNSNYQCDELLYDGKIVKRWEITTTGWEKQLKFEKVSEEEYISNVEVSFPHQTHHGNENDKKLFYLCLATFALLLGISVIITWISKKKRGKIQKKNEY